jgi:hypothetical protein
MDCEQLLFEALSRSVTACQAAISVYALMIKDSEFCTKENALTTYIRPPQPICFAK